MIPMNKTEDSTSCPVYTIRSANMEESDIMGYRNCAFKEEFLSRLKMLKGEVCISLVI